MTSQILCPAPARHAGETLHGFTIERVVAVPEIRATVYEARHGATGARFLHLHCDDTENLYAVTFRTPPPDSTGVAHILEHSVLAGSQHYPVKDAYNLLVRGSLHTFINAFTAPDFTCYPVSSQVRADFYNLATVYTDLVLRPLLKRSTFMREAHHLEIGPDEELAVSGIVFNEMKGAYSTPERVAYSTNFQRLLPDTPYGVESGGLPECIPDLTYEQFCDFHRRYYSPSNAWFFFYGNLPVDDHLAFLERQLMGFKRVEIDSAVPAQPRWVQPRVVDAQFPIGPGDSLERRSIVNVAWLTSPTEDLQERLILEVLAEALAGHAAAPLRRALIDSGLGEDISPVSGLETSYQQLPFTIGLRGTDAKHAGAIEGLALEALARVAREGLPRDLLEAAIHQVEYHGLEIQRSPFPFALNLLFRVLSTWIHDGDAVTPLTLPTLMQSVRERWEADPDLFRKAVTRWLVENPHRLRSVIVPSRTLTQERDEQLRQRLAKLKRTLSESDLKRIRDDVAELNREQQTKDSPEDLACLPRLQLTDIPRDVETIPTAERRIDGVRLLEHDLFTNSIAYVDVVFDVADVPEELQPYLSLLGAAATGMGAAGEDYATFATRKAHVTGAVEAELDAHEPLTGGGTIQLFILHARGLRRNIPAMVRVLRDILIDLDLNDVARLKDILSEERNGLRASVAPQGHRFGWRSAAAGLSLSAWRDEQWSGITQLHFLDELTKTFSDDPQRVIATLAELRSWVLRRGRVMLNVTGDAESLAALRAPLTELLAALPEGGAAGDPSAPTLPGVNPAIAIPGQVCYVARVYPVPRHTDKCAPQLHALATHLNTGWLYKKIRVEGGAYGGMSLYGPLDGQFVMMSYRDPNLEKTLEVYDMVFNDFLGEELSEEDMRMIVIGSMARLDRPLDPAQKGRVSLERSLVGLTDEERRRYRAGVLATTAASLRTCARDVLASRRASARQAVYAPKARIEQANRALTQPFTVVPGV
jgi:Zn-dependent M16 (insulinase) family peptidase